MATDGKTKDRTKKRTRKQLVLNTNPVVVVVPPKVNPKYHVPINSAGVAWGTKKAFPPADWDHWKAFGMKPTLDREAVIAKYHSQKVMTWEIGVAYGRILSELWSKGVKPKVSSLEEWDSNVYYSKRKG